MRSIRDTIAVRGPDSYLHFVQRLLVFKAGTVSWTENNKPGMQSTVMGAGIDLKHSHRADILVDDSLNKRCYVNNYTIHFAGKKTF